MWISIKGKSLQNIFAIKMRNMILYYSFQGKMYVESIYSFGCLKFFL